jgi:hypothetical protein
VSVAQLVNNVPASCGTQSFLTMFTLKPMTDLIMNPDKVSITDSNPKPRKTLILPLFGFKAYV